MQVKVWMRHHNEITNELIGHALALDVELDVDDEPDVTVILEHVFEQLNIGGDLVPAADWMDGFREAGWWSLSVKDVVELNDKPWICASVGWEPLDEFDWAEMPKETDWSPAKERELMRAWISA